MFLIVFFVCFIKITAFMKTKTIIDATTIIFPVVARPYLCYVSESKGFGFCQTTSFLVTAATTTTTAAAEEFLAGSRPLSHRTQESNIPFGHLPSLRLKIGVG